MRLIVLLSLLVGASPSLALDMTGWDQLAEVEVSETGDDETWRAVKVFPDALIETADDFSISGYIVPITAQPYLETFLLVSDPADCPFCGSSGYGPSLEVHMKRPLPDTPEFSEITLRGRLELIDDPETYQAYRLLDAVPDGD